MFETIRRKLNIYWLTIPLIIISFIYICLVGHTYENVISIYDVSTYFGHGEWEQGRYDMMDCTTVEPDSEGNVDILEAYMENSEVHIKVKSKTPGKVFVSYGFGENSNNLIVLYVHKTGVITYDDYFGRCTGSKVVNGAWMLYMLLIIVHLIRKYRRNLRSNMYQYKNILFLGIIIFLSVILLFQSFALVIDLGIVDALYNVMGTLQYLGMYTFPIVVIAFILASISNMRLFIKEGRSWRNLLGFILGIFMIVAAVTPIAIEEFFQRTDIVDVHNWTGIARFVVMFITNVCATLVAYFDCVLIATIVLGIRAARHVPSFDKDYIIIHGCQIRKDGTLTKLLQSRTDRAVWFAEKQKEAAGKDIIFVPSGGKGSDEVISEGEAIQRYLLEQGIPEEQIMIEDQSKNTEENLINAAALIRDRSGEDAKIAFSTTNYHAFRAGLLATNNGIKAEGVGSRTKSYFWLNAFIREFIATIYSERRTHAAVIGLMIAINLFVVIAMYISNVILS